jgi:hypothetical protein
MDYHDRLKDVAHSLAYWITSEYKRDRNTGDHYEEDFAFCAAENQMTEHDYFTELVWSEEAQITAELMKMSPEDQAFLIAWNEYEEEYLPPFAKNNVIPLFPEKQAIAYNTDDIPF